MTHRQDAIQTLQALLKSGTEVDRCNTCRSLGTLQAEESIDDLIAALRDEDVDVCIDAVTALGDINHESAIPALLESLQNDPDGEIRTAIIEALGKLGDKRSIPALIDICANRPDSLEWDGDWDPWWDIQQKAVETLGHIKAEEAVPTLLAIFSDEDCQDIESEVLTALARIGGPGIKALMKVYDKGSSRQRRRVMLALRYADISQDLARGLKDPAKDVRIAAINALEYRKAKHFLGALMLLFKDPDAEVRSTAVNAVSKLSQLKGTSDLDTEKLIALLSDSDSRVRNTALKVLIAAPTTELNETQRQAVHRCLSDKEPYVIKSACELSGALKDHTVIPKLIDIASNTHLYSDIRAQALFALGSIGIINDDITDFIKKRVTDKRQQVRLAALSTLMTLDKNYDPSEINITRPLDIAIRALRGHVSHDEPKQDHNSVVHVQFQEKIEAGTEEHFQTSNIDMDEEDEVSSGATSTLAAIARDNVEAALHTNNTSRDNELSITDNVTSFPGSDKIEELDEFTDIVEQNKAAGNWLAAKNATEKTLNITDDVRYLAAKMLANSDEANVIKALIEALNDKDEILCKEAANAITQIAERDPTNPELLNAFGVLITQLLASNHETRLACVQALGALGNKEAISTLLPFLKDKEPAIRIHSIAALIKLTEGHPLVSEKYMILNVVEPEVVHKNIAAMLDDPEAGVRVAAAKALSQRLINESDIKGNETKKQTITQIINSAFKGDGGQARNMGQILRTIDPILSTEKVLPLIKKFKDSTERRFAIEIIEELFKP